ncbi:MAG: hypothetical protein M3Y31_07745 [Gemmatimonadota bacterium]|jgi:hypothetical protein|nr:hypothetical protein [Gemmatimonadota bacterium]
MARRFLEIDGAQWEITTPGTVTQYVKDEFPLVFTRVDGARRERRIVRYSPLVRHRESSLAALTDAELTSLFRRSQPSWTSPELGYQR